MPCSIRASYDVTPEGGNLHIPGARKSPLKFEYPVYENANEMLGFAIRFSFRSVRLGRMWRLLHRLPGLRTLLWWLWWRSVSEQTLLRGLSGFRHCGGGRSAVLSRCRILVGQQILRLEAWTLGGAEWPESLAPRALRHTGILIEQPRSGGFQPPRAIWRSAIP